MANRSKAKGTKAETEIKQLFLDLGYHARRTPPGSKWDVEVELSSHRGRSIPVLMTRPDHGEWLATVRIADLINLANVPAHHAPHLRIESKRYKRFSLHSIFLQKFGKGGTT